MSNARAAFVCCVPLAALSVGCGELSPETGELRMACVDVDSNPAVSVSFKNDIRPRMNGTVAGIRGCKTCHYEHATGGVTREGYIATGLNLETLGDLRLGGRNTPPGVIVAPGKPCSSAIVQKLQGTFREARMPRGGPYWGPADIQLVIDWIAEGAKGEASD